jgi:PD-(D/E)XK endonuclease
LGKQREKSPATGLEIFKTYKQRGEWVELLFMTRAAKRGYVVSKPWGDSARYDIGIEQDGRFKRVQVKGTDYRERDGYICHLAGTKLKAYTAKQIDYFAIYLLPEDIWYIFPAKRLMGQGVVMLSPHLRGSVHERYKEAWELLDSRKRVAVRGAKGAANAIRRKRGRCNHNGAAGDRPTG